MAITYTEKTLQKAVGYIKEKLRENNFDEYTFSHKSGAHVSVCPCAYGEIRKFEDVMFYTMRCDVLNLCGSEDLEYVARTLLTLEDLIEEDKKEKARFFKFWKENIRDGRGDRTEKEWMDLISLYSDWHKDLYGYRPKGLGPDTPPGT